MDEMNDHVYEYTHDGGGPLFLSEARKIVVKHAFFVEVFENRRIPMEKKLTYFIETLPRVLADFGINDT